MELVPTNNKLPASIAAMKAQLGDIASSIMGGIPLGGHPKIGIKASRFRLTGEKGEEEVWQNLTIPLIILDGNPNVSKRWYAGTYDPATEAKAPDCASDNGERPNPGVASPQSAGCAACPHNVWGSKITTSGKSSKACSDSKRLAVVLAEDPDGLIYELSVPAASMKDLAATMGKMAKAGVPVPSVIFEVSFDEETDFPKLIFTPKGYIDDNTVAIIMRQLTSDKKLKVIGMDAPAAPEVRTTVTYHKAPPAPVIVPAAPVASPPVAPEAPRRVRRTKAQIEADNAQPGEQMDMFDPPAAKPNAAAATLVNPPPSDAALDSLLDGIFDAPQGGANEYDR